jgi:putative SOS response-associated peptidase YedK
MCGRYTLTIDKSTIEHHFGSKFYITQPSYDWLPTFNAAPKGGASGQRNGSATRTHDRKIAPALRPRPTSRCSRHRSAAATASCSPTATMWRAVGKHKQPCRITLSMTGIYSASSEMAPAMQAHANPH